MADKNTNISNDKKNTVSSSDDLFKLDDEPELSKEQVLELQTKFRLQNKYSLEETRTRNVLMVGRSRSGKSTAVGVLKDPCFEPKEMSIFSDTFEPKFQSFSLDDKLNSTKYTFNVIDTPGLKEVTQIGTTARTDEVILNTINYCLKNEITKINTLVIFIAFELGVTKDDIESFKSYLEKFSHDKISIIVCITRAEDKPQKWKDNITSQLHQHPYFAEVLKKPNIKIKFLGCVDAIKNKTLSDINDLRKLYANVYKMREELLKVVFDSEEQVKLIDLPIASKPKEEVMDLFKKQHSILDYLVNVTDFELAEVHLKVTEFASTVNTMASHEGIMMDSEVQPKWQEIKKRMETLLKQSKMPASMRERFIGKLFIAVN